MTRRITLALGLWAAMCSAQTTVNGGRVFTGIVKSSGANATVDFSGAASTVPVATGPLVSRPSTCTNGQMYFATDATAGQNLSYCTGSPGTWSNAAGAGGPTVVQTNQSNTYTTGTQDFSGSAHTLPSKRGTTALLPSTCTTGEEYFATDATAGQNKYYCTATNTWSQQASGAAGGSSGNLQTNNGTGGLTGQANIYSSVYAGGSEYQQGENCLKNIAVPYAAWTANATSQQIPIAVVPANWIPTDLSITETSALVCNTSCQSSSGAGGMTSWQYGLGTSTAPTYYDSYTSGSPAAFSASNVSGQAATNASHTIYLYLAVTNINPGVLGSGGASASTYLTSGSVNVRICGEVGQ
jgi:hypothetical protein